jgi:uncharacterized protein (DUF488 family)
VPAPPQVLTVGHGAQPAEALLGALRQARVAVLVDVRRYPGSRRHPQFGREALAGALAAAGIRYEWHGEALGGRRSRSPGSRHTALRQPGFAGYADHMDTVQFRAAVDSLVARTAGPAADQVAGPLDGPAADQVAGPPADLAGTGRMAIMCAETVWWHCHRMLIADALVMRGARVVHLLGAGRRQDHRLHPTARLGDDGWPVYDVSDALPGL